MSGDRVPGLLEAGDRSRLTVVLERARSMGFLGPGPIDDQIERSLALVPGILGSIAAGPPSPPGHERRPAGGLPAGTTGDTHPDTSPAQIPSEAPGRPPATPGAVAALPMPSKGPETSEEAGLAPDPTSTASVRAIDLGSGGGLPGLVLALALPQWHWTLLDGSVRRTDALREAVGALGLAERTTVVSARAEDAARTALRGTYDVAVARGFAAAAPTAECAAPFLRIGGRLLVTEPPGGAPHRWPEELLSQLGLAPSGSMTAPVAAQVLLAVEECPTRYPRRNGIPVKRPLW